MSLDLVARALALGLATGARGVLGVAAPVLADPDASQRTRRAVRAAVVGELVGDKLPTTPSRLDHAETRALSGAVGGFLLARRRGARWDGILAAKVVATAGAVVGTGLGAAWRQVAVDQDWPDLPAALAEDAVAIALAAWSVRG